VEAEIVPVQLVPRVVPDLEGECQYAEDLASFCQMLLEQLTRHAPRHAGERDTVLQWVKSELLDRYADFLTDTPPHHVNPAGQETHRCIDGVFVETVKTIRRFQRSLPPAPPPPPVIIPQAVLPQQVSGLFYEE
jgi:hypothetical protein